MPTAARVLEAAAAVVKGLAAGGDREVGTLAVVEVRERVAVPDSVVGLVEVEAGFEIEALPRRCSSYRPSCFSCCFVRPSFYRVPCWHRSSANFQASLQTE